MRNRVWASPVTLWGESVDLAPGHYRPRLLLGEALQNEGRRDEAVVQFRGRLVDRGGVAELGEDDQADVAKGAVTDDGAVDHAEHVADAAGDLVAAARVGEIGLAGGGVIANFGGHSHAAL